MRDTVASLRAYFLVVVLFHFVDNPTLLSPALLRVEPGYWLIWTGFAVGFLIAGIQLKKEMQQGAHWIRWMLVAKMLVLAIEVVLTATAEGEVRRMDIGFDIIGIAICAYLLASIRRLVAEMTEASGVAPARAI